MLARYRGWTSVRDEPGHPLAALEGRELDGSGVRVLAGRSSRFGARYFALLRANDAALDQAPLLSGLHHSGPLPSYNWIEVAETGDGLCEQQIAELFSWLLEVIPAGGHLMVEYDSPGRAETAEGLAHRVPAIATPLGELLFRIGCGAHFKDWQIAEGGSEGPRKVQAYKPPSEAVAARWKREAARDVEAFLEQPAAGSDAGQRARERAAALLPLLRGDAQR